MIFMRAIDRNKSQLSGQLFKNMKIELEQLKKEGISLNVELVGLKNLKINQCWRLECDVPSTEPDLPKLMEKLNKPLAMGLIDHE